MTQRVKILITMLMVMLILASVVSIFIERAAATSPLKQQILKVGFVQSYLNSHDFLSHCEVTAQGVFSRLLDENILREKVQDCLVVSQSLQASRPGQGYGAYVEAIAHRYLGNEGAAQTALLRSHTMVPNEAWLAEKRVVFALEELSRQQLADHPFIWEDIAVAMHRRDTRETLAVLYFKHDPIKQQMASIIETRPAKIQNAMLHAIRQFARSGL